MRWLICWSAEGWADLERLDSDVADRVMNALDRFVLEGLGDVRRLAGIDPPEYRLRVGKWRVRFSIDHRTERLHVLHVLRRDEAYS